MFSILFMTTVILGFIVGTMFIPLENDFASDLEFIPFLNYARNNELQNAEYVNKGEIVGAEDIVFDKQGNFYTGSEDGHFWKISPDGIRTVVGRSPGRPLGLKLTHDESRIIVADAVLGLVSLDLNTNLITILVSDYNGTVLKFVDGLEISKDGSTIYFTDASMNYGYHNLAMEALAGVPSGRLFKYSTKTKTVTLLLSGLHLANGIALNKDEDYLLICETLKGRIRRFWLNGPKTGTNDILVTGLPGAVDNISYNGKGTFYVAGGVRLQGSIVLTVAPHVPIKRFLARLPKSLKPDVEPYTMIAAIDEKTGKKLAYGTCAVEHDGYLYIGTWRSDWIAKYKL